MDQRELVERAKRGDHDAFAALVDPRSRAAGRGGPPHPPGPGARARRGPGDAHPRLARPARAPRSGPVRRLAPSPDRQRLSRPRPAPATASDRGRASPIDSPAASDHSGALADRELVDAALRRLDPGHRAVVALHYLLGMPLPEVAASLGIPLGHGQVPAALRARRDAPVGDRRARPGPDAGPRRAGRMTTESRFERQLPAILEDLYLGPSPDYRDEVLAAATRSRQRPAWTFPGRWLPMADIASRPAFAPRVPWRTIGVALLIVALARRGDRVYRRLPPDAAPAAVRRRRGNGLVAYATRRRHLRRGSGVRERDPRSSTVRRARRRTRLLAGRDAPRVPATGRRQRPAGRGHRRRQSPTARTRSS